MKTKVLSATGIASTSFLFLLLGVAVHVYAQQDQHGDKQNQPKQEQQHSQPHQQQHSEQPPQPQQQQHAQQQQQHSQQREKKKKKMLNSSNNSRNMSNSNSTRLSRALKSSSVWCRAPGSSTAPKTGSQTTAPGNNVAATAVIASLMTDTMATLGRSMGSESTGFLSWWLVDIRVSSTRVIGLVSLTHGRGPGQITGMTPMTSTSATLTMAITCSTADIPPSELRSASRCRSKCRGANLLLPTSELENQCLRLCAAEWSVHLGQF